MIEAIYTMIDEKHIGLQEVRESALMHLLLQALLLLCLAINFTCRGCRASAFLEGICHLFLLMLCLLLYWVGCHVRRRFPVFCFVLVFVFMTTGIEVVNCQFSTITVFT